MSQEKQVKEWVRECLTETSKINIFGRAQDLIREAASDVSKGKRKSVPGHPNRFLPPKKRKATSTLQPKMFTLILFPMPFDEDKKGYRADESDEVVSGYVKLYPEQTETEIRELICKVFKSKYRLIRANDFEFVKRNKNVITKPTVPSDFEWGFEAIKSLAGQGKLCTRLTVDLAALVFNEKNTSDSVIQKIPKKI